MRKMMSSMKKGTAVAMAAVMCISLAGCGGSTKKVVAEERNDSNHHCSRNANRDSTGNRGC